MRGRLLLLALALQLSTAAFSEDQRLSLGGRHLLVRYWPEQQELALQVRQDAQNALSALEELLKLKVEQTVLIEIVRSHREFVQRLGQDIAPWTLGVSLHHAGHVIVKPQGTERMRELVVHELTHVALDMKLAQTRGEPPRWLHEGLAQWMQGGISEAQKTVLGVAAVENRVLAFSQLEKAFAGKRAEVDLAYAQSYTLVAYIVENGPPEALHTFLDYFAVTGDQELALRKAMGMPLDVIEQRWRRDTRARYLSRGVPLTVELAIFGAMLLVFFVAIFVRFRRAKEIRERMQEEERLARLLSGIADDGEDEFLEGTNDEWHIRE